MNDSMQEIRTSNIPNYPLMKYIDSHTTLRYGTDYRIIFRIWGGVNLPYLVKALLQSQSTINI